MQDLPAGRLDPVISLDPRILESFVHINGILNIQ